MLPRILTSLLLIPFVMVVIWYGSLPYFLFLLGVTTLSFWEYSLIAEEGGYPNQLGIGLFGVSILLFALFLDGVVPWGPLHVAPTPYFVFILWLFVVFVREFCRKDKSYSFLRVITTVMGVLICSLLLGHILLLRELKLVVGEGFQPAGRQIVFFLFLVIWSVDMGAWAVGRMMGKSQLAPRISPKKTWEGAVGGTVLACGVGWILQQTFLRATFQGLEALIYAFIISFTAQMSDLMESFIKRSFGVKNSSEILPGHGGVFDRFDSFIFSAPFFYYLLLGTGRFQ